jgi:hypothetical protein
MKPTTPKPSRGIWQGGSTGNAQVDRTRGMADAAMRRYGGSPPTTAHDTIRPETKIKVRPTLKGGGGIKASITTRFKTPQGKKK